MAPDCDQFVAWQKEPALLPAPLNKPLSVILIWDRYEKTVYGLWPQLTAHFAACGVGISERAVRRRIAASRFRAFTVKSSTPGHSLLPRLKSLGAIEKKTNQVYLVGAPALAAVVGHDELSSKEVG